MTSTSRNPRRALAAAILALAVAAAPPALAQAGRDAGAARELAKRGYELRQRGEYEAARVDLTESARLDPQSKTLINLADCEEHLGRLVDAQKHWAQARDLAAQEGNLRIKSEAESRLTALEARLPKLTLRLAANAPKGVEILRDGTQLGAASLGVALPLDPGKHVVRVRAPGYEDKSYDAEVKERDALELTVNVGAKLPDVVRRDEPTRPVEGGTSTTRIVGYGVAGVGVVGLGLGAFFGLRAKSQNDDSNAPGRCNGDVCDHAGAESRRDAITSARISTVAFAVGGAMVVGGLVLVLTSPKAKTAATVGIGPGFARVGVRW